MLKLGFGLQLHGVLEGLTLTALQKFLLFISKKKYDDNYMGQ